MSLENRGVCSYLRITQIYSYTQEILSLKIPCVQMHTGSSPITVINSSRIILCRHEKDTCVLQAAFLTIIWLRFSRFKQLHQKPVNVYGVYAPLNDAVAELHQGKEREALFLVAHSYVSLCSHLYRLLLGPFYRILARSTRMRSIK